MPVGKDNARLDVQTRIGETGLIEDCPLTWDGEPLYSVETVQEGLFAGDAFQQMPGQLAIEEPAFKAGDHVVFSPVDEAPEMSGEISSVADASCGIEIYGCADGRRYWVGSRNIRHEIEHETEWRVKHGRYVEDMRDGR
jgi:hypothetical protein